MELETVSWKNFLNKMNDKSIAVWPLGSIEQHGDWLPLGTDLSIAEELSKFLNDESDMVKIPAMPFGNATSFNASFPGTINISHQTILCFYREVIDNLVKHGINAFFLIVGHGGNVPPLMGAIDDMCGRHSPFYCSIYKWWDGDRVNQSLKKYGMDGKHASRDEKALYTALNLKADVALQIPEYTTGNHTFCQYMDVKKLKKYYPSGIIDSNHNIPSGAGMEILQACKHDILKSYKDLKRILSQ